MDLRKTSPGIAAGPATPGAAAPCANATDHAIFASGGVSFRIASGGGRILDLRFDGMPLMHPPEDPARYGSTFWPSPQSLWKWPPPEALHMGGYGMTTRADVVIEAAGNPDPKTGLRALKRFEPGPFHGSVRIRYTLENRGGRPASWAPWEITQLLPGGLVFFPGTIDPSRRKNDFAVPDFDASHGALWRKAEALPSGVTGLAIGTSAEGWIAYARNRVLMVKSFGVVPPERHAPGEGQVELFFDGDGAFWEMEVQGAYEEIAPGGRVELDVGWAFVALKRPAEDTPRERLMELARQLNHQRE